MILTIEKEAAPDDHFAAGPYCRVKLPCGGGVGGASRRPRVRGWTVSSAGIEPDAGSISAPNDHFGAGPHCGEIGSGSGGVDGARSSPTVRGDVVSTARIDPLAVSDSSTQTIIPAPVQIAV